MEIMIFELIINIDHGKTLIKANPEKDGASRGRDSRNFS
jgi:hypothetical protein